MEIRSKKEFYRLWESGCLGNKLRTWRDPRDAQRSGVPVVGFRYSDPKGGGAPWWGVVDNKGIVDRFNEIVLTGFDPRYLVVCEAAPDERATIQGEVCRALGYAGLSGLIGAVVNGRRMRDSIAAGDLKPRTGSEVAVLLNTYMDPNSRYDLEQMLDLYPDAAVEFTCYAINVGDLRNRNTIFWEVRNY
jgi:hypothetical protein